MSQHCCSAEDRIKYLEKQGCTVIEHVTYHDGQKDNEQGANRLGFYVNDGAYRIVQMTSSNAVQDAITEGISKPGEPPVNVKMGTTVNDIKPIIWQIRRQYGAKNCFSMVPQDVTIGGNNELGASAVPDGNNVTVKRTACYPLWRIEGAGLLVYKTHNGKEIGTVRYFRICTIEGNKVWQVEDNQNVSLSKPRGGGSENDRIPANQLFELYEVGTTEDVSTKAMRDAEVTASNATVVKQVYMCTKPATVDDLLRNISIQAVTVSCDQGWASNPNRGRWSWFELAIFEDPPKEGQDVKPGDIKQLDNKPLTWTSHDNVLSNQFQTLEGPKFTWDHPIWRNIQQGDSVALLMCAQYPWWKNKVQQAELKIERIKLTKVVSVSSD